MTKIKGLEEIKEFIAELLHEFDSAEPEEIENICELWINECRATDLKRFG